MLPLLLHMKRPGMSLGLFTLVTSLYFCALSRMPVQRWH